jgi:hypothetical protein
MTASRAAIIALYEGPAYLWIKAALYALLLANFGFYLFEDWSRTSFSLTDAASFYDWVREFNTSLDEVAWFTLLLIFELETYVLDESGWSPRLARIVLLIKVITFWLIGHTLFVNFTALTEILGPVSASAVSDLCELTDTGQSWLFNLDYTLISSETCEVLPQAPQYWEIPGEPVVTSSAGIDLARRLAWCDFIETAAWLSVGAAMEAAIRITDRGVTSGYAVTALGWLKFGLYALILALGIYWAYLGHWVYLWDEFLWIFGFAFLEVNLDGWRDEIDNEVSDDLSN